LKLFFYNIFLGLYKLAISLAAPFNPKAKKWIAGRKGILQKMEDSIGKNDKVIWMHCASLGEFEQGRPVLEKLKLHYPKYKLLLTFFSPSGYEIRKDYKGADWVFYLPMDGRRTAKQFLAITKPSLVIFVKYEFWYYYLKTIKAQNIPCLLIAALLKKDTSPFNAYTGLLKEMLSCFNHLFVQTENSKRIADEMGLADQCTIAGDTRFDRVIEIAAHHTPIPAIEKFIGHAKAIIAGSTWPDDEEVLQKAIQKINDPLLKLIIAPHEVDEKHIISLQKLFPDSVLYSDIEKNPAIISSCLIIDNIGMLSRLYKYAHITYVGGGLGSKGLHNTLEAAVYNKIVLFGPHYQKYAEAIGLVQSGGGISFFDYKKDGNMLAQLMEGLLNDTVDYNKRSNEAGRFVKNNSGATQKIMHYIQEKRLLTN
jgi:3-deoxy-D-manno-octulosonic-acid transferase